MTGSDHPVVAFIGLGRMGAPMASNIIAAGFPVIVCDSDPAALARFRGAAKATGDPAEAANGASIVITMLPTGAVVADVLARAAPPAGCLVIDMSSSAPDEVRATASRLAGKNVAMIDAPVSGGVRKAVSGELAILAGGDDADLERGRPVLETMGARLFHCGPVGAGAAMKAINNLLSATALAATVEALQIGARFGLDPETMTDILNASTGRNNTTEVKVKPFILSGSYGSGFAMDLMVKDIGIAEGIARATDTDIPVSAQALAVWRDALKALAQTGDDAPDHTALAHYYETLTGTSLVRDP